MVDGLPQSLPDGQGQTSQFAATSASRIEVLKGPVASLYGNASGGVLQAFTRDPLPTPSFRCRALRGPTTFIGRLSVLRYAWRLRLCGGLWAFGLRGLSRIQRG